MLFALEYIIFSVNCYINTHIMKRALIVMNDWGIVLMAKVILDAAHGGNNIGYIHDGRMEKTDNLNLAIATGRKLEEYGIDTIYTRQSDTYISPLTRLKFAEKNNGDLYLSFHRMNGSTPNSGPGMDFFVNREDNARIYAENINSRLEKLGFKSYGVKDNLSDLLLDNLKIPAIIMNIGFIDSDEDNEFYDKNIEKTAQAIAEGVLETLNRQKQKDSKKSYENIDVKTYELYEEEFPNVLAISPGEVKVILDAGHGGNDFGNINNNRVEKNDNLRLALAVGNILRRSGITVIYTRTSDKTVSSMERINLANREGGDLLITFHRMTGGMVNCHLGVETFINNENTTGEAVALNINDNLYQAGFHNHGIYCESEVSILKDTVMPAIMFMIGYIDSDMDNMHFDTQFYEITLAVANGILLTFGNAGGEPRMEENQDENKIAHYRIQVGMFSDYTDAVIVNNHMIKQGFFSHIIRQGKLYAVQAGDYLKLDDAAAFERTLRMQDYHTLIVAV